MYLLWYQNLHRRKTSVLNFQAHWESFSCSIPCVYVYECVCSSRQSLNGSDLASTYGKSKACPADVSSGTEGWVVSLARTHSSAPVTTWLNSCCLERCYWQVLQRDEVGNGDYLLIGLYQTGETGIEAGVWKFRIKYEWTFKRKAPAAVDAHSTCCPHVCPGTALRNPGTLGTFRVKIFSRWTKKLYGFIYLKQWAQDVFFHRAHQRDGCIKVGGSDFAILSKTLIGFISWFGGSTCASSIKVIPRDQMSALESYGRSFDVSHITTSGAILEGNDGKDSR